MRSKTAHKLPPEELVTLQPLADIARGGMGKVQLARIVDGRLANKFVAVKRLNKEHEKDQAFVDMFLDETWMTSAIKSPHVIGVEAWGHDAQGMYLAIELVQGVSLSRLIKEARAQKEPFAERTVAFLLSQVCAGLDAAHDLTSEGEALNLVHRDLTPGNILVSFDGMVKIADFGIAKANSRLTETSAGVMKGKPAYMAPEQARGMEVDRRADLFSAGVIMYELLAGKRPWIAADDLEMLIAMATTEPIDLAEVRKVNQVFLDVVRACLHKDRDKRPASAREIREPLDAWRKERGFDTDDLASLSHFVQRNTPQQMAWFRRATAGGLAQGGSTFKEVEEKLDRERGIAHTNDPRFPHRSNSPAAGSPSVAPGQAAPGFPPPRRPSGEVPATRSAPPPARPQPPPPRQPADDLAATRVYDGPPSLRQPIPSPLAQHSPQAPHPGAHPHAGPHRLAGTMAMPETVSALPRPPPGPTARAAATPLPPLSQRPPAMSGPPSSQRPPISSGPSSPPYTGPVIGWDGRPITPQPVATQMAPAPPIAPPPLAPTVANPGASSPEWRAPALGSTVIAQPLPDMYPASPRPNPFHTGPGLNEPTSMGSVLVVRKKRNTTAIVVLVLVILLLAGAAAAYYFRAHIPFLAPQG